MLMTLCLSFTLISSANAYAANLKDNSCCNVRDLADITSTYFNDSGNVVKIFDNGTEAEYLKNGDVVIYDYSHVYSDGLVPPTTKAAPVSIGTIRYDIITKSCVIVEMLTGKDPCVIFMQYILKGTGRPPASGLYIVSGTYHPGYIPGCEPRYSAPCNAGYWTYTYAKK